MHRNRRERQTPLHSILQSLSASSGAPSNSVLLLATLALAAGAAFAAPAAASSSDGASALQMESFEKAWSLIDQRYWDPDFGGLDWQAVREELRPRAAEARTNAELRDVLEEMISRLGQSHFGVIPSADSRDESVSDDGPECSRELSQRVQELIAADGLELQSAGPGFDFRFVEGEALVVQVDDGGPAAQSGVAPGWGLHEVDGQSVEQIAGCLGASLEPRALEALVYKVVSRLLLGDEDTTLRLRLVEPGEGGATVDHDLALRRTIPADTKTVSFGNLPPMDFRFADALAPLPGWSDADGRALVLRFNVWMMPVAEAFENALLAALGGEEQVAGVVLDLRGNPGGVAGLSPGLAGYFVPTAESLGTLRYRQDTLHLRINPRLVSRSGERIEPYSGPLAILIDQFSASTSEIFAAGLQDLGRAHVVGERSMGAALPAVIQELPNGDFLMHAMADLERPGGDRVEGEGVEPDVEVPHTRERLRQGRDEPMEAALRWIAEQAAADGVESESDSALGGDPEEERG